MIRAAEPETRPQVLEILDSAQSLGLKVLRMWAFNEGPLQYNTLQKYPGEPPCQYACLDCKDMPCHDLHMPHMKALRNTPCATRHMPCH